MAVRLTFQIKGLAELQANIERLRVEAPGATAAAVYTEALGIMRRSRSLVPVDTSELINSAWCAMPDVSAPDPIARMGYSAPYALPVHELVENKHPNGGQANFLREPFEAALTGYARRLLARILANIKADVTAPQADSTIPTSPPSEATLRRKVGRHLARTGRRHEAARHFLSSEKNRMRAQQMAMVGAAFDKGRG